MNKAFMIKLGLICSDRVNAMLISSSTNLILGSLLFDSSPISGTCIIFSLSEATFKFYDLLLPLCNFQAGVQIRECGGATPPIISALSLSAV